MTGVPPATTATLEKPAASACHASATTTLTTRTQSHVTPEAASVSSAWATPKALPAPAVSSATMATPWPTAADVSSRHTPDCPTMSDSGAFPCVSSGCTCVLSGTDPSQCTDGLCQCDRQTGACPCRKHVEGPACDRCAPHHWNYGQATGCEPCACDPGHSTGAHCNMVMARGHSRFQSWQCLFVVGDGPCPSSAVHRPVPLPSRLWGQAVHRM